ncbi:MAG: P-II family nitrogen regulator [Planctomycetia bacterium]
MRLVVAVLRPAQLEAVRQALAAVHVTRLTVCDAQGFRAGGIAQESVMEIAVNDEFLERTVDTIRQALDPAGAGQVGDAADAAAGRLFVLPIEEAVQIYREVRGPEAV